MKILTKSKNKQSKTIKKQRNLKDPKLLLPILLVAFAAGFFVYRSFAATAKNKVPMVDVGFSNIQVGKITPGSGHVGVDIWYVRDKSFNDKSGIYNPCHDNTNPYYGACQLSKNGPISYYKVLRFRPDGSNFPYGIFIDNKNDNRCTTDQPWCNKQATSFEHNWGKMVTGGSLEIYPHAPGTVDSIPSSNIAGGVRIYFDSFPTKANGGRYTVDIGDIKLPQLGEPDVGKMNGFITDNGKKITEGRVTFDYFQNGGDRRTSTGYIVSGFSTSSSNADGYYTSGPVPNGSSYKLYVTDNNTGKKIIIDGLEIKGTDRRIDFDLSKECFGFKSIPCVVDQPANTESSPTNPAVKTPRN
jgi:hypothetical protein